MKSPLTELSDVKARINNIPKLREFVKDFNNKSKEVKKMTEFKTEKDIDDLEKYILTNKNHDIPSVLALSDEAIKGLENYLNESFYDDIVEIEEKKVAILTVGDLKKVLQDIPDSCEIVFLPKNIDELKEILVKETSCIGRHLNYIDISIIHNNNLLIITEGKGEKDE